MKKGHGSSGGWLVHRLVRAGALVVGGELGSSLYRLLVGGQGRLEFAPVAHLLKGRQAARGWVAPAGAKGWSRVEGPPLLRTSERLVRVALGDEGGALCHRGISGPIRRSSGVRRSAWSRSAAARCVRSPASSASAASRFGSGSSRTSAIAASATTG